MPSIVAFQLKQIFNQNLIFFRKWHFRFHVCPGSAETLARGGGLTNQHLIACSLSNISAKSYENRLMCIEVIVCYICVVFLRHGVCMMYSVTLMFFFVISEIKHNEIDYKTPKSYKIKKLHPARIRTYNLENAALQ